MFFEKKKWVNRIKIHDEVVTSLAPNVLLRKFSLNSSITPMFTICTHIALLAFEMDDNSMIFKVYDFFFFNRNPKIGGNTKDSSLSKMTLPIVVIQSLVLEK